MRRRIKQYYGFTQLQATEWERDRDEGIDTAAVTEINTDQLLKNKAPSNAESGQGWQSFVSIILFYLLLTAGIHAVVGDVVRGQIALVLAPSAGQIAKGALATAPPLLLGLLLDQQDWDWIRRVDKVTREVAVQLFGKQRQVAKVIAISIVLGAVVGFSEECCFRGYLPLLLTGNTALPTAAIVLMCSLLFGAFHPATWAYSIGAAVYGTYFHCLLLATGSLLVPIISHGLYDTVALVRYHLKVTDVAGHNRST